MAGERARSGRSTRRKGRAAREVSIQGVLSDSEPGDRNTVHPSLGARRLIMPPEIRRYRNNGEPAITVQNVSVGDGGKAIVGNVTQHASVSVSDNSGAPAVTDARMVSMPDRGAREHDPVTHLPLTSL